MESVRSAFKTQDGTKIFSQYWKPTSTARAVAVQVHGLGEHSGRYVHVAAHFGAHAIALYAFDHRGHGRSDGKRGHVPNYDALMEELDLAFAEVDALFPGIPKILYGHSWGGNIALNYLIRRQPNVVGAIVTDPWLHIPAVPALQESMARFVNNLFPGLTQNNKIDANNLSTDLEVGKAYLADPLVHPMISVRLFVDSDAAAKYALANADKVQVPLLLMHGGDDVVTLPSGSKAFHEAMQRDHQFQIWEGMRHEIHNEREQAKVLESMTNFMNGILTS